MLQSRLVIITAAMTRSFAAVTNILVSANNSPDFSPMFDASLLTSGVPSSQACLLCRVLLFRSDVFIIIIIED